MPEKCYIHIISYISNANFQHFLKLSIYYSPSALFSRFLALICAICAVLTPRTHGLHLNRQPRIYALEALDHSRSTPFNSMSPTPTSPSTSNSIIKPSYRFLRIDCKRASTSQFSIKFVDAISTRRKCFFLLEYFNDI
jgi:hypothetical protein